jgi:ribosomal protein L17
MVFQPGKSGNPGGKQKAKPFRDALRMAIADAEGDNKALRKVAEALVSKGMEGDVSAIREIADRLDGKVPQAVVGDDDHPPVGIIITGVVRPDDRENDPA